MRGTRTILMVLAVGLVSAAGLLPADLKVALAEREAYQKGDNPALAASAQEIQESVELAWDSLESTGKNPRKSPRWFKQAEIETRSLLKKLETLQHDMGFEDRPLLDKAKARLQQVHDDLLTGLMEGKSK